MTNPFLISEFAPIAPLQHQVRRLVALDRPTTGNLASLISPTGYAYLNWVFRGTIRATQGRRTLLDVTGPGIYLGGVLAQGPVQVDYVSPYFEVSVEFTATGLFELLGIHGAELRDTARVVGSDNFSRYGLLLRHTFEYFSGTTGAQRADNAVASIQKCLLSFVPDALIAPIVVRRAAERIEASNGNESIADIAHALRVSSAHLRRVFSPIVGLRPKEFAQMLRFSAAMERLLSFPEYGGADTGLTAGYYDQSHFINVMRQMTGSSPRRYERERRRCPDELFRRCPTVQSLDIGVGQTPADINPGANSEGSRPTK